jgi:putative flippase GtrA
VNGSTDWRFLVFGRARTTQAQFLRYTVVGGLAFVIDFDSLFLLTEYGHVYYLVSAAIAFLLGLTFNYTLSRMWVFDHRAINNTALEFGIFAGIGLIGLALNESGMWILKEVAGFHYLVAKIGTTAVVFLWNFFARKYSLFR